LERIQDFFGEEIAGRLLPVEYAVHQVRVQGWVGHPETARPSGRWQYFFVNQRYVRDRVLAHALQEAYRGYLMVGLQPVAFLFVELPPEAVDVNVHPTKIEVRFREQQTVYQAVLVAVRRALQQASLTPALSAASLVPAPRWTPAAPAASVGTLARPAAPPSHPAATPSDAELPPRRSGTLTQAPPVPDGVEADPATSSANSAAMTAPTSVAAASSVAPAAAHEAKEPPSPPAPETTWFAAGQPVRAMQLHNTYLIVEMPDGLLLVDQHALHERILYEQFQRQVLAGTLSQQTLLIPEPVDLTASQAALLLEHRAALEKVGLSVSEFGGSTVLVSAVPACWKRSAAELVQLAANYLAELDRAPEPNLLLDELLKRMACRSAVKAGDPLRPEEITFLLEHRHLLDNAHHCPHGRPTALFLSTQELERQFRRLG
jgi:DNA mismatch repair protein MutL